MPQLSLDIDEITLHEIETAAKHEHMSIKEYAEKKLAESIKSSWPADYEELYGCIDDDSFSIETCSDFSHDAPRETL